MPAFYLTFIAVLLAGIGARDQVTVAGLAARQGRRPGVLLVGILTSVLTAALAAYGAQWMLGTLPPPARPIFAACALAIAGAESVIIVPRSTLREPTNSLGALVLVLLTQQVTDSVRFLVVGLGVGLAGPWLSGAAGALGGAALLTFAWSRPDLLDTAAARWTRRGVGAVLVSAALVMFLWR
jgi:disulfide bond formation protein DsbB